ncbi:muconolactone Delta-isomerase family protein [Streptomyces sp. NPDC093252]|uniref:muconolactone Delta-isomerase family protein n=1 Tax=Streptomyces sp. NPDC093252 TaxID=3154980 RepID=UPI00343B803F
MREFLVRITTTVPEGTPPEEVAARRAAEAEHAEELAAAGHLWRLWRPEGERRSSVGIWCADDEAELHAKVLDTLPLRPWMTVTVTPLAPHPSDPGRADGSP